ncbi:hypothetical protein [Microbacterium sp. NPDC076895]|uniref:hypothetical protein n=1 Tax=Microbacterium sp. NPDC076895 TaxID=3154957 RepID=UPI00342DABDF
MSEPSVVAPEIAEALRHNYPDSRYQSATRQAIAEDGSFANEGAALVHVGTPRAAKSATMRLDSEPCRNPPLPRES